MYRAETRPDCSATDDQYSQDADAVVNPAKETFATFGIEAHLEHSDVGGHAISEERFGNFIEWITAVA